MEDLENIENNQEVEVIPTDNTQEELQENVEETTEVIEVPEDNSAEIEAEQERLRREHEEYLNSFPSTTIFYQDLIVKGNVKSLGFPVRNPRQAEAYGILDNHFDESELTYIGTKECGTWYLKGYEKPEPLLEELKAQKFAQISAEAHKYSQYECENMYLTSSKGFRINADRKAQDNLKGLIGIGLTCKFKDYDNEFHSGTTVEDLNVMLLECYQNGALMYQKKFDYEAQVVNAQSKDDLNFDVVFEMADFSGNN
jgi:hypothetical protein